MEIKIANLVPEKAYQILLKGVEVPLIKTNQLTLQSFCFQPFNKNSMGKNDIDNSTQQDVDNDEFQEKSKDNPGTQVIVVETGDERADLCSEKIGGNSNQPLDTNAKSHSIISSSQLRKVENDCNFEERKLYSNRELATNTVESISMKTKISIPYTSMKS